MLTHQGRYIQTFSQKGTERWKGEIGKRKMKGEQTKANELKKKLREKRNKRLT
jgi:hypothetical protein